MQAQSQKDSQLIPLSTFAFSICQTLLYPDLKTVGWGLMMALDSLKEGSS